MSAGRVDHPLRQFAELSMQYGHGWLAVLLVLAAGAYSTLFLPWFMGQNESFLVGKPLPDTLLWYSPAQLFSLAESYGEAGRAQYIFGAFTFDFVFPLVYGAALVVLAGWLARPYRHANLRQAYLLFAFPILTIASDFLENASVSAVMAVSPEHPIVLAWVAVIATPLKWLAFTISGLVLVSVFILRVANALAKAFRPA